MENNCPDAIIVGSGAGGGTAAHILTRRGLRVVVLEKGPRFTAEDFLPYDELHFLHHKALIPHIDNDPMIYVGPDCQPTRSERWFAANIVGGSTMIWEAHVVRYTAEDFGVLSYLDMQSLPDAKNISMVNWPWTYDEFQPFFEQAEHDWAVSGLTNQSPSQESFRPGYEYPMPPLRPHASTPFLMQAFAKARMQPYRGPRGINSRTYQGRPGTPFCGYCQNFGCAVNARSSSTNTVLERALATGLCDLRTGHYVTRIDFKNGRVKGVFYKTESDGKEQHLSASKVFVSVQAIESARLFLYSLIPDPSKLIGHYLTYHTKGYAELTFKNQPVWDAGIDGKYQPRTGLGSLQLRDTYVINDPRTYLRKGGKFTIEDPYTLVTPIKLVKETGLWGEALQRRLLELRSQGGVSFSFTGEAISLYDNRVELDPKIKDPWGIPVARTYYRHQKYDLDLSKYALDRVVDIMQCAGGEVRRFEPQKEANPGYGHAHGTLRAGNDPGSSVLDVNCQSHTVKGLYVLDCSFFPTSGASNPTLTLIANAYRVCNLVRRD